MSFSVTGCLIVPINISEVRFASDLLGTQLLLEYNHFLLANVHSSSRGRLKATFKYYYLTHVSSLQNILIEKSLNKHSILLSRRFRLITIISADSVSLICIHNSPLDGACVLY